MEQRTETARFDMSVLWPIVLLICQVIVWVNIGQVFQLPAILIQPLLIGPLVGAIITASIYWGKTKQAQRQIQAAQQAGDPSLVIVQQNPANRVVAKTGIVLIIVVGSLAVLAALLVGLLFIALILDPGPLFQW